MKGDVLPDHLIRFSNSVFINNLKCNIKSIFFMPGLSLFIADDMGER